MKVKITVLTACAFMLTNCSKSEKDVPAELSQSKKTASEMTVSAACYSNPVISEAGGDPYCFKYNGTYY
ncbi:hypothetical protein, partial [Daejeonella sp.]|uniref:hypothetical protein n=1 Tax=Daejeonella sp. TaxID=2805397 RepID=UPI0030C2C56B